MAQFRAVIRGVRDTTVSRLGSKNSGITARVDGWKSGVAVEATYDEATGQDVFRVYRTAGSLFPVGEQIAVVRSEETVEAST